MVDEAGLVLVLKERRIASTGLVHYEFEPNVPGDLLNMEHERIPFLAKRKRDKPVNRRSRINDYC